MVGRSKKNKISEMLREKCMLYKTNSRLEIATEQSGGKNLKS